MMRVFALLGYTVVMVGLWRFVNVFVKNHREKLLNKALIDNGDLINPPTTLWFMTKNLRAISSRRSIRTKTALRMPIVMVTPHLLMAAGATRTSRR